jgi:hypothetical protein
MNATQRYGEISSVTFQMAIFPHFYLISACLCCQWVAFRVYIQNHSVLDFSLCFDQANLVFMICISGFQLQTLFGFQLSKIDHCQSLSLIKNAFEVFYSTCSAHSFRRVRRYLRFGCK